MCKFSILITTRQRTSMLHNLLKSIYEYTRNKNEVEIRVIYDDDDLVTSNYVNSEFKINFPQPVVETHFHIRKRSPDLVNDYHNWCATKFAQGKYIIFSNDDAIFELDGWDVRSYEKLAEFERIYRDGILYGIPEDFEKEPHRNINNWMACFPLISKKVVDVLGYAFDPEFKRDGADWALAATFYALNRVVNLRDSIIIKHLSFRSGRREKDVLDRYANSLQLTSPPADKFVERNVLKLREYINNFKG